MRAELTAPLEGHAGWGVAGSGLHSPVHPTYTARSLALSASLAKECEEEGGRVLETGRAGGGTRRTHLCQGHGDHGAPTAASPGRQASQVLFIHPEIYF